MSGCLGDGKNSGPYITGECQTIELALRELQIHIDTYHMNERKKRLKCDFSGCDFETEVLPDEGAIEHLRIHTNLKHNPKIEPGENASSNSRENKAFYKANKCSVQYKKKQTFESFEKEIEVWKEATKGVADHARNLMFIEMLSTTENEEVKNFYTTRIMNNKGIVKTVDNLMNELKEEFGKSAKQKWDSTFKRIFDFQWEENTPKSAWECLEIDRFNVMDVLKSRDGGEAHDDSKYLVDKMLIRN